MPGLRSTLVFFTTEFPYGTGEPFIENEIVYLARAFNRVIIVTNSAVQQRKRVVPENVELVSYAYASSTAWKIRAVTSFFGSAIQEELNFIKQRAGLKFSTTVAKVLLAGYAKALQTAKVLDELLKEERERHDKVVLYSYWMNDMALAAAYYKQQHPDIKAVCRAHRWDIYMEEQPGAYLPFRKFIVENLDGCYSISEHGAEYLKQVTGKQVKLARLGTLQRADGPKAGSRGVFRLVSCSYIIERKRLHLIIEALSKIEGIAIEWVHLGGGPLQEEVERLAKEKLQGNITFRFTGQINNQQVISFYKNESVDLFINVSSSEGIPVSIMEAFSFGIPALATNVGGAAEIISNGENGYLLPENPDAALISKLIKDYIQKTDKAKEGFGLNAFNTWADKYNAEKNYTAFTNALLH